MTGHPDAPGSGPAGAPAPRSLLRQSAFRRLGASVLVGTVGMVGEQVVLGWLTLELTDSPLMVGVASGLRMAPLLLLGFPAGALADRGNRLGLLRLANLGMAAATAALGLTAVLGPVPLWALLALTFAGGGARALQQVAQQTLAHDLVGASRLGEALARLGLMMRLGGLAGSFVTGALIGRFGPGWAYLTVALAYLLSALVLGTGPDRRAPAVASPPAPAAGGVAGLLSTFRRERALLWLAGLTAAGEILGFSHQTVLPSLARDVLHVGPAGLGVMYAARQVGGIAALAAVGRLGQVSHRGALLLAVFAGFGAAVALLGFSPGYGAVLGLLVLANAAGALADVLGQTLMLLSVPPALRGRAGGTWVVAIGLAPLGQLQIGALASAFGAAAALGVSGATLTVVAVAGACVARLRRL